MSTNRIFKISHKTANLCSLDSGALAGLRHRTVVDYRNGSSGITIWQEEHLADFETPLHRHDCDETITLIEGQILALSANQIFEINPYETFYIPEWVAHGFKVISSEPVKLLAVFNSSNPGVFKMDGSKTSPPWEGGDSNHLN